MSRCNCLYFLHHLIDLRRVRTTKVVKYPCSTFNEQLHVSRGELFSPCHSQMTNGKKAIINMQNKSCTSAQTGLMSRNEKNFCTLVIMNDIKHVQWRKCLEWWIFSSFSFFQMIQISPTSICSSLFNFHLPKLKYKQSWGQEADLACHKTLMSHSWIPAKTRTGKS